MKYNYQDILGMGFHFAKNQMDQYIDYKKMVDKEMNKIKNKHK